MPGHRDLRRIDPGAERPGEEAVDDDADVARLVHEIGLPRAPGRVRVLERKDRCRDHEAGFRPGAQKAAVRGRRQREPVGEDDQRMGAG